jgi:ABC-type methionine transport system permease subunit
MVRARRIQEPLEVVPGRGGLGRIALWERRLALHRHDKVVVTVALVILLLLLEA